MRIAVAVALLACLTTSPALAENSPNPHKAPANKVQANKAPASKGPASKRAVKPPVVKAAPVPAKPTVAQLAALGDPAAQYQLAQDYRDGKGVPKNLAEAASWFAMAAGNGENGAAKDLALAYEQGAGVPHDLHQAALWWFRAAIRGDEAAKTRFLELLIAGDTDHVGGATGAAWLESLANTGNLDAILALGEVYEKGEDLPMDRERARHWYLEAAYANDAEAKFRLGRMLLAEPSAWRLAYKDRAREVDNKERDKLYASRAAALQAGGDEREPDIIRPGMVEAEEWLLEAAHQGHAEAQYTLGMAYLGGMDLPFDLIDAVGWLSAAAWNGHASALMELADLAAKGQGFAGKDPVRAWVNYDMAATQGTKIAEEARDHLAKSMTPRQLGRARQIVQDLRGNLSE